MKTKSLSCILRELNLVNAWTCRTASFYATERLGWTFNYYYAEHRIRIYLLPSTYSGATLLAGFKGARYNEHVGIQAKIPLLQEYTSDMVLAFFLIKNEHNGIPIQQDV